MQLCILLFSFVLLVHGQANTTTGDVNITTTEVATTAAHSTSGDVTTGAISTSTTTASSTTESASTGSASTTAGTGGSTTGTPAPNNTEVCETHQDCSSCIESSACVWCESKKECQSGAWFGSSNCDDWRWKQCHVKGLYPIYGAAGLLALIFLIICICICRCCCCARKKRKLKDFNEFKTLKVLDEEKEALIEKKESKHPKTDARRAELMKKYGNKLGSVNSDV